MYSLNLEARAGIEPAYTELQSAASPLYHRALEWILNWSGKRDSNSRPQPWQGCALPTELFPLCITRKLVLASLCAACILHEGLALSSM